MIQVTHQFRVHVGGSKFYETVLFRAVDGGPSVLIKRFGRMTEKKSGGQTKFESFTTAQEATNAWDDIWRKKEKPREYSVVGTVDHGICKLLRGEMEIAGVERGPGFIRVATREQVITVAEAHYGRNGGMELTIADALALSDRYDPNAGVVYEAPVYEEVDRGSDYGSW